MDKYEVAVSKILSDAVPKLNIDLYDLATDRIQRFSAALSRLLLDEQEKFDLIVGAGDSGSFVIEVTKLVYQELGKRVPPILVLPVVRFNNDDEKEERFDNNYLGETVRKELGKVGQIKQILFVDDEIRKGWTAKTCFELIASNYPHPIVCTIVAEHHFFEWHFDIPNISVRYFSHAKSVYGIIHIFSNLITDRLYEQLRMASDKITDRNQALTLLVTGAYRKLDGRNAYHDKGLEEGLKLSFPEYAAIKMDLLRTIKYLVKKGILRYRKGQIFFKF